MTTVALLLQTQWTGVALAAIATAQVVALAYIGSRVVKHGNRLDRDEEQLRQLDRRER